MATIIAASTAIIGTWAPADNVRYSDNPANVAQPGVAVRLELAEGPANYELVPGQLSDAIRLQLEASPVQYEFVPGDTRTGVRIQLANGTVAYFFFSSNSRWDGVALNLVYAYRSVDRRTLVGTVYDADTGNPLPDVKLHFEATDVILLFDASKADGSGGYIVFLDTGATYTAAGFHEPSCRVFELVEFREFPDHTDIYLRVPEHCVIPPVVFMPGEPLEDVLNKERGFHDYEPVKVAAVVRASDVFRSENVPGGVAVAIGAEETVVDVTLANAISIDSVLVGADNDCEFRFEIGIAEPVPRRQLNVPQTAGDLVPNGGLYANTGVRLRVYCRNMTAGTTAASLTARATIIGRNFL